MKRPLALLFLLSTLLSLSSACIHDQFAKEVLKGPDGLEDTSVNSEGRMLATSPESIRIVPYYFIDGYSERIQTTITEQIIPAAIDFYQKALKVKRLTSNIPLSNSYVYPCVEQPATSDMPSSVAADLVLLVTAVTKTSSNYIAAAGACYRAPVTNRPYMGVIEFNTAFGFADDTEFNFRNQLYTVLHEIGHVLGFSSHLYPYYIDPLTNIPLSSPTVTRTVNGVDQTILTLAPLTAKLQTYFGCNTDAELALIEQQGGSGSVGSHFERRVFMNEVMTASATIDSKVSEIFFALLEGTGWYYPDYTMAEPMFWGKDQGCEFVKTPCLVAQQTDFPEHFCETLNKDSCTFSREAYGVCGNTVTNARSSSVKTAWNYFGNQITVLDSFADNCPYYFSYTQTECKDSSNLAINLAGGEYFGENSRCFTGTLGNSGVKVSAAPFCLKYACDFSSGTKVKVTVGSTTVTCSAAGNINVPGYFGTLNCPNPAEFCATSGASFCPRGCMGRGTCNSGVCSCDPGYDGEDCSFTGVMDFSGVKTYYAIDVGTHEQTNSSNIIIYAVIGAGAVAVIAVVALVVTKYKRAKARKAAVRAQEQRRQERRQNRQSRQNDYAVNGNPSPQADYVDPRAISLGVVQNQQQPVQMYVMPQQQYYAQNQNPRMQMQGNMVYYPEANVYQDQNGNIYPGPPQSNMNPQPQQGHRVHIPR